MSWSTKFGDNQEDKNFQYRIDPKPRKQKEDVEGIYDKLIDIILNAKKDIKFHRSCETIDGAKRYADARGLRAKEYDLNNDGIDDVIVYNSAGKPIMVNGYSVTPSELPYRQEYMKQNPTPTDRINAGGYKQWLYDAVWEAKKDFDKYGERKVKYENGALPDIVKNSHSYGYKKLTAPKRKMSNRQLINRFIASTLQEFIEATMSEYEKFLNTVLPRFKLYSLANDCVMDIAIANMCGVNVTVLGKTPAERYTILKQQIKQNQKVINEKIFNNQNGIDQLFTTTHDAVIRFFSVAIDKMASAVGEDLITDADMDKMKEEDPKNLRVRIIELKDKYSDACEKVKPDLLFNIAYATPLDSPLPDEPGPNVPGGKQLKGVAKHVTPTGVF